MARCLTPYYVKNNRYGLDADSISKIPVPCGRCPTCIENRTNQMILRLTEEEKVQQASAFITLTYGTAYCPISKNGFPTLRKTDVQKFFKRLRKSLKDRTIKYYLVGEYGTTTRRPHYHAIIFNVTLEEVQKAWNMGVCHAGKLTTNSIAYTCKYMAKHHQHRKAHGRDDREPEFSLCSQGLGMAYITKREAWHLANKDRVYAIIPGGIKVPLPRYFKERIYDESTRKSQALKVKALDQQKEVEDREKYTHRTGDHTEEGYQQFRKAVLDAVLTNYYENSEKNRKKI